MRILILVPTLALLGACASQPAPISTDPVADVTAKVESQLTPVQIGGQTADPVKGLQDAAWNLDQAQSLGILDKNDAAPGCLHSVLNDLGIPALGPDGNPVPISTPAAAQFQPKRDDVLFSPASILYIRAKQAQKLAGTNIGAQISIACKAEMGQLQIDLVRAGIKGGAGFAATLGGGGLLGVPLAAP